MQMIVDNPFSVPLIPNALYKEAKNNIVSQYSKNLERIEVPVHKVYDGSMDKTIYVLATDGRENEYVHRDLEVQDREMWKIYELPCIMQNGVLEGFITQVL